jgi:hypothetical protein
MSFEIYPLRIIASLDLNEGEKNNEPMNEDVYISIIKNIYNIMGCREYYINPTTDGELRWRIVHSYDKNSEEAMERWQNNIYEVSTKRCAQITKTMCEIGSRTYALPWFDGTNSMDTFLLKTSYPIT